MVVHPLVACLGDADADDDAGYDQTKNDGPGREDGIRHERDADGWDNTHHTRYRNVDDDQLPTTDLDQSVWVCIEGHHSQKLCDVAWGRSSYLER